MYGRAGGFEPSIVEWHRRGKADRPSGTARHIARRITAADPRWAGPDEAGDGRPELEVVGIRAGVAPGTHLVTFDGPGESVELRLTARDRTAYAEGAIAAARWLAAEDRAAGLHPFDAVVDDLLATTRTGALATPA
jgi:4-hydroxy-tetrahydrodipicolinate reductase